VADELGATGKYPQGKLNDDDEGELCIAVAADKAKQVVVVDFGKPVHWLAMPKANIIEFANILIAKAAELD
jgi:hypothetical protein